MILVSLADASAHIRRDQDDDDALLLLYVKAASKSVLNYIQGPGIDGLVDSAGDIIEDSNGDPLYVPEDVQSATLLLVGYLYRNRDENTDGAFARGWLPDPVTALLAPYRDPSLA